MRLLRRDIAGHAALSVIAASAFFRIWPTNLVWDDAGFVLRYLDNFARGHFYCFNPTDGPIFGISSFLHGILSGLLAWSHVLGPETSMFACNFLGLAALSFFTLRLLVRHGGNEPLVYAAWILLLTGCPQLVINLKQGLETPMHVAIVLAGFLAVTIGRSRTTWACCALLVISKLDAAPAAAVIGIIEFGRTAFARDRAGWHRTVVNLVLFCLLPLAVWSAFATAVFGSPIPQSAMAKLLYHSHPTDSWFPFLSGFRGLGTLYCVGAAMLALHLGWQLGTRRRPVATLLAPLLMGLGVLGGYYVYNPGERMGWYYALPEYLFLLQIVLLICDLGRGFGRTVRNLGGLVAIAWLAALTVPVTLQHARHTIWYLHVCEAERIAAGEWIRDRAAPGDTLLSANGHVARAAGIYTIDASGLNSRAAIARRLNFSLLVRECQPQWLAKQELIYEDLQLARGYELVKTYYNISGLVGFPSLRVYRRNGGPVMITNSLLGPDHVRADGSVDTRAGGAYLIAHGSRFSLHLVPRLGNPTALILGLVKTDQEMDLTAKYSDDNGIPIGDTSIHLDRRAPAEDVTGISQEWRLSFPPGLHPRDVVISVRSSATGEPAQVSLVEPVLLGTCARDDSRDRGR